MFSTKRLANVKYGKFQIFIDSVCNSTKLCYVQKHTVRKTARTADPELLAVREKLVYCDYFQNKKVRTGWKQQRMEECKQQSYQERVRYREACKSASSVFQNKDVDDDRDQESFLGIEEKYRNREWEEQNIFPAKNVPHDTVDSSIQKPDGDDLASLYEKYRTLEKDYLELKESCLSVDGQLDVEQVEKCNTIPDANTKELLKVPLTWMTDYERYNDTLMRTNKPGIYGTPISDSKLSVVPCGGCGAPLHCRDPVIPGYLPSELFLHSDKEDLKVTTCQRCHFLKIYKAALKVNVPHEHYADTLKVIRKEKCAVILVVDLTDFPCSIWPDLGNVLHPQTPIFLVGNKVDVLPLDSPDALQYIKKQLLENVRALTNVKATNIVHTQLTSAKTGYGIEELINKLYKIWRYKGNVYLIGCTNVGKSSLFNTLLNSDYCKTQAEGLVQRATISVWPGTTLNLLKFPMLNPTRKKLLLRAQRLSSESKSKHLEEFYRRQVFKMTGNMNFATLKGNIGKTFKISVKGNEADPFAAGSYRSNTRIMGLNEDDPLYEKSYWCYDTPGTVHLAQITDLLTTEELLLTLPRWILWPRTFLFAPGQSVFLGGLGRVDFSKGDEIMKCTIFASKKLPVNICKIEDADDVYQQLLRTKAFVVPTNDPERLKTWPSLRSKEICVTGIAKTESVADVILSSAGWISVTPAEGRNVTLTAWTPEGRGIHLRTPALLRKSVIHRGNRVEGTPMFRYGRRAYVK